MKQRRASVSTCEWRWFAQSAVLVMYIGGAVAGAESRGGRQHQLLLDEAGLGVILGELLQPLLQRAPEQVQTLGRLAQTTLRLQITQSNITQDCQSSQKASLHQSHPQIAEWRQKIITDSISPGCFFYSYI